MPQPVPMYDDLSSDYDRFVNWSSRLNYELPFLVSLLQGGRTGQVLDAACGTGMHAIALAQRGYSACGADLSAKMVERARLNSAEAGVKMRFEAVGFGGLRAVFGDRSCTGLLCLGNSLPHLLSPDSLGAALEDFAACLQPGGVLILQSRNFDQVMAKQQRWMEPQSHREGEREWIFLRFYDFEPDGLIRFNMLTLQRSGGAGWTQRITSTHLRPLLQAELVSALRSAGFTQLTSYGGLDGSPFDPTTSGNLVVTAIIP